MKSPRITQTLAAALTLLSLTACESDSKSAPEIPEIQTETLLTEAAVTTTTTQSTTAPDTAASESTTVTEPPKTYDKRLDLYDSLDIVDNDLSLIARLTFPGDEIDTESLKKYLDVNITLYEKTDLSFLTELTGLKALSITNGEEDAVPEPWSESYVESYDFLKELDNLELLRISKEPEFNTSCLQDMDSLKYLWFYGTNIDFEGYFPDLKELVISGGELSSVDLYDFFPNLTGIGTYGVNINLKSVSKMDKLEILYLSIGQSYEDIGEIAANKNLRSLSLTPRGKGGYPVVINGDFLFELPKLQYLWCYEGAISDETIERLLEINPECDAFNHGL